MRHITTKTLFFIILASSGLAKGQDYLPLVKDDTMTQNGTSFGKQHLNGIGSALLKTSNLKEIQWWMTCIIKR